ncbi:glycosyltransferase family 4 protein [Patescibacteria group bacterium]|nr:glycosyltransferase family 4 protein [Patescibacteria group bacterium]
MTIGIDINEANISQRVGVNQIAFATFSNMVKHLDPLDNIIALGKQGPLPDMPEPSDNLIYDIFGPKKFWVLTGLTKRLLFGKPKIDVLFSPSHYTPLLSRVPSVVYIMDLSFERFGTDYFTDTDLSQLQKWTPLSIKKAKTVLTISKFSKNEIVKIYQVPEEKIKVVYPGFNKDLFHGKIPLTKQNQIKRKYKIGGSYLLYVGTLQPRKNLIRLIKAFSQLNRPRLKLVIGGKRGWFYEQIYDQVKDLKIEDKVIFAGYIPDEDLPGLIKSSRAYVLPSLYEGFGMPPVEAQAVGVPVVVSKTSSLPEVVGDSGIYINDPRSVASIKDAIETALNLPQEKRAEIIAQGKENAKRFNWEQTSKQILKILKQIA